MTGCVKSWQWGIFWRNIGTALQDKKDGEALKGNEEVLKGNEDMLKGKK